MRVVVEGEKEMQQRDEEVRARSKARNDLETFVIARKDNLSDPAFKDVVVEADVCISWSRFIFPQLLVFRFSFPLEHIFECFERGE